MICGLYMSCEEKLAMVTDLDYRKLEFDKLYLDKQLLCKLHLFCCL